MDINGILDRIVEHNTPDNHGTKSTGEYVRTFRRGAIAANVFRRQNASGTPYMDIALSRAWKDAKSGKEGYSGIFYARNADDLKAVIDEASSFIEAAEQPAPGVRMSR